jgi:hypothetical protein
LADGPAAIAGKLGGKAFWVGGNVFLLLLPAIGVSTLRDSLPALQSGLRLSDFSFGDHEYPPANEFTASFMAVRFQPRPGVSAVAFLERLDERFFVDQMPATATGGSELELKSANRAFVSLHEELRIFEGHLQWRCSRRERPSNDRSGSTAVLCELSQSTLRICYVRVRESGQAARD